MKVFLLHRDRDVDNDRPPPANAADLSADLEVNTVLAAMANGDPFLFEVAQKTVLAGLAVDVETILYRQQVLRDCLTNPAAIRRIFALTVEAAERRRRESYGLFSDTPAAMLSGSVRVVEIYCDVLRELKIVCRDAAARFKSEGLRRFCQMLERELDEDYFESIRIELRHLKLREGVLMTAHPGRTGVGVDRALREPGLRDRNWFLRLLPPYPETYSFYLHPSDEGGAQALSDLRNRGLNLVADALRQSADHIAGFFQALGFEIGFYVGCLNLVDRLAGRYPISFPTPNVGARNFSCRGLCDVGLALTMTGEVTGNDADAGDAPLVIVTGANRGGKSTFLRSVGLAQLMLQSGMFVIADAFSAPLCDGLFTHFMREEDAAMTSGKFDDELGRMSEIADQMGRRPILLFNESFAGTNEREGSEVARQIVSALLASGIRVVFVTHMYTFAHGFIGATGQNVLFLRAHRGANATSPFKLSVGEPLDTAFAEDLYHRILAPALPP
jgi:hypothetical protein